MFTNGQIIGENTFLTFNYDTRLEDAFSTMGIPFDYSFQAGTVHYHDTAKASQKDQGIKILKLHGSVNIGRGDHLSMPNVLGHYSDVLSNGAGPDLVPPTWNKRVTSHLEGVWSRAVEQLKTATRIVVIGFLRIPINSDTCSNPFRTVFRDIRTVVGAKRRSALTFSGVSELSQAFPLAGRLFSEPERRRVPESPLPKVSRPGHPQMG